MADGRWQMAKAFSWQCGPAGFEVGVIERIDVGVGQAHVVNNDFADIAVQRAKALGFAHIRKSGRAGGECAAGSSVLAESAGDSGAVLAIGGHQQSASRAPQRR